MLRGLAICPDSELAEKLNQVLIETNQVSIVRDLDRYPNAVELMRYVRAHAPHLVLVSVESLPKAMEVVGIIEQQAPGVQIVAIGRSCDPAILLDVMRSGIREFLSMPFNPQTVYDSLMRVEEAALKNPPTIEVTDQLFAFLPSKQGVGTSTIALNAAKSISRHPDTSVLLMDMDLTSGIIGFMLKLTNTHSVVDAAENSHNLDESLWPQLISKVGNMEVLQSGRLNPDFRIESTQVRHMIEFARRHYKAICVDLSGNLERYSLEIMHESKQIFLVVTPEIPSLHLAREKYNYLRNLDLGDRVKVLLNRSHKKALITSGQVEDLLGVPVMMSFTNDYQGVHRALQSGRAVEPATDLGKQFTDLAARILQKKVAHEGDTRKRLAEYFSLLPGKNAPAGSHKAS